MSSRGVVNPSVGTLLRLSDALGIQVQDGTVTVEAAGQPVVLEPGDAVAFPGDVPHSYANPGKSPARFSLAVFEPGVGPASRTEVSHG